VSSLARFHPRFQEVLSKTTVYVTKVWLGCFGGDSPKCVHLFSNAEWASALENTLDRSLQHSWKTLVTTVMDASGKNHYSGNANLKPSQAYPVDFGKRVAELFKAYRRASVFVYNLQTFNITGWRKQAKLKSTLLHVAASFLASRRFKCGGLPTPSCNVNICVYLYLVLSPLVQMPCLEAARANPVVVSDVTCDEENISDISGRMCFEDIWEDAELCSVVRWLRSQRTNAKRMRR
jgi:hypothetical protein